MTAEPAPDAAVQIATEALRQLDVPIRAPVMLAEAMVAAHARAGWLHRPGYVAALEAVAEAARDVYADSTLWPDLRAPLAYAARERGLSDLADPIETAAEAAMGEVEELRAQLDAARAELAALRAVAVQGAERDELLCSAREVTARGELHAALDALLPAVPQTPASDGGAP